MDCVVKTDLETMRSRGFGFVLFKESGAIDKVMEEKSHSLHGRNIDPKRAKARGGRDSVKKVFVGGIDPELPVEEIREYFSQKGKIEEIDLPFDKQKGQRRQFCFITFESEESVDAVCEEPVQYIGSNKIDVKKATPKERGPGQFGSDGQWGGRGGWGPPGGGPPGRGRGRGRGGYNQGWGGGYDQGGYDQGGYGQGWGGYGWGGGPNDYYNWYNQQGYGQWGGYPGYDYSNYGGGYDYSAWYGQGQGQGEGQQQQGGDNSNYDWAAWYASQGQQPPAQQGGDQQQQGSIQPPPAGTGPPSSSQPTSYGKAPSTSGSDTQTSQGYHPYQR